MSSVPNPRAEATFQMLDELLRALSLLVRPATDGADHRQDVANPMLQLLQQRTLQLLGLHRARHVHEGDHGSAMILFGLVFYLLSSLLYFAASRRLARDWHQGH